MSWKKGGEEDGKRVFGLGFSVKRLTQHWRRVNRNALGRGREPSFIEQNESISAFLVGRNISERKKRETGKHGNYGEETPAGLQLISQKIP